MRVFKSKSNAKIFVILASITLPLLQQAPLYADSEQLRPQLKEHYQTKQSESLTQKRQLMNIWSNSEYVKPKYPIPQATQARNKKQNSFLYIQAVNYLNQSIKFKSEYSKQNKIIELEQKLFKNKLWWQEIDHQDTIKRKRNYKQHKLALKLVELAHSGLKTLDQIDDLDLQLSKNTKALRSRLYRNYISNQIALNQTELALTALTKLIRINPLKADWIMHYYFAMCLNTRLKLAQRNNGIPEKKLNQIRKNKNFHLMQSVNLRFGKASIEFKKIQETIYREELGNAKTSQGIQF